jgi:hypothetical protein
MRTKAQNSRVNSQPREENVLGFTRLDIRHTTGNESRERGARVETNLRFANQDQENLLRAATAT